jgi:hypothetical protein
VKRRIVAGGEDIGAGGLSVSGNLAATNENVNFLRAGSGAFGALSVAPGGSINFNNATITGLGGLKLPNSLTLNSLLLTAADNQSQVLTLTQAGQTASLSVDSAGLLRVQGSGLSAATLAIASDAGVGGTLKVNHLQSTASSMTLSASNISTSGSLTIGASGDLILGSGSSGSAHLLGSRDTRGQCAAVAAPMITNTCSVTFANAYGSSPVVVATPAGTDPSLVTGFVVRSSAAGFTINFTVSKPAGIVFNYIVEG